MTTTVYISIGNSDDKLTQHSWSQFVGCADAAIRFRASRVHGWWLSPSNEPWQNACWCIEIGDDEQRGLKNVLGGYATQFGQDSIAWAVAETEFITASASLRS